MSLRGRLNQEEKERQLPRGGILNYRRRLGGGAKGAMVAADMATEALRSLQKQQIGCPCLKVVGGGCLLSLRRCLA